MSKKVSLSMIIVLIVALLSSSIAMAADSPATTMSRPGVRIGRCLLR